MRGIVKHWDALKQIKTDHYEILLFNEIWQIRDFEHLKIPNFKIANVKQRDAQRGGGVLIFIKENLEFEKIESPSINGIIETVAIKIQNTVITSLYRPLAGNKQVFSEKLIEWIDSMRNIKILIAGDFNLNYLNNDREFFNSLETSTGLSAKISEVTRLSSNTCIDNIVTNLPGNHRVSNICLADHQGLISNILQSAKKTKKSSYKYREMSERNWTTFSTELTNLTIDGDCINEKWNDICNKIKGVVQKSFPEKTTTIKHKFIMSQGLLKSRDKKNKLLKKYKRGEIDKSEYVRYNKIYRKLVITEQERNFHEKIIESGADSRKKWRVLKDELKLTEKKEVISSIRINDTTINEKSGIAKAFKDHFETCATNLASEIQTNGDCEILFDQQQDWGFRPITLTELIKIIDSLLPKSSCGFDLLTNRMLKKEKLRMSILLIDLINETIMSNTFPDVLKIAKVIPLFKKGDPTNLSNYRPISLLPVMSKVLEKVINKQITSKLDELHLIDDNQYGFRTAHSTEDAVIKFIDTIEKAKTKHKYVISIHIDVSKAFDSCNHDIMKQKLKRIGLNPTSLQLMSSYLKDRVQELWIDEECGGRFVINIGVGQGTVLGPTLFKIYILDMFLSTKLFSLRFADDSNLVGMGNKKEETELEINNELKNLHTWFCKNKLTLHPDKSRYIVHTKDKQIAIKLGEKQLMRCGYDQQEEGVKFLGVLIDENLDWKLQINNVRKKIGKGNYLLWRYRNRLTASMKKTIYESFVRTHITYCLSVWGAKKSAANTELKKQLKRIWKKIGQRTQHTNSRLCENKILKFEDELKLAEMRIVWRWEKKKIPLGLKDIITESANIRLRNRNFIRDRSWSNDSISYRLASLAIKDIKDIEIARSKNGLKNKFKNNCFLVKYMTNCRIRNCAICNL